MKKHLIGIAFFLGAVITLSVLLYPFVSNYINSRNQSRVVTRYLDEVTGLDGGNREELLNKAHEYNKTLRSKAYRFKFTQKDTAEYRSLLDTGLGVMGILSIDKIDVHLPIYHGTDEGVLQIGIGHLQGTSLPVGGIGTHSFITGHRGLPSSTLLSNLDKMMEGDRFTLYILGETLTYQVDHIQVVEPDDTRSLRIEPDMDYCTLVTCTPYGKNTHRLLVRGRRTDTAATAGWEGVYADVKRLDRAIALAMLAVPVLPALIVYIVYRCRKIRKEGGVYR